MGTNRRQLAEPQVPPNVPVSLQVGGAAVMAVGIWTLVEKSGYLSILASSTFPASAYILIFAGALVVTTGFLGFGAIIREQKGCLSMVSVPLSLSTVSILPWRVSVGLCCVVARKHHTCPPGCAYQTKQGTEETGEPEQGGCYGDRGGYALRVCRT